MDRCRKIDRFDTSEDAAKGIDGQTPFVKIDLFRNGKWIDDEAIPTANPDDYEMVLSEKWRKRFERTAKRREQRRKKEGIESAQRKDPAWKRGGDSWRENLVDEKQRLETERKRIVRYGQGSASRISRLEVTLDACFDRYESENAPCLWPAMPM